MSRFSTAFSRSLVLALATACAAAAASDVGEALESFVRSHAPSGLPAIEKVRSFPPESLGVSVAVRRSFEDHYLKFLEEYRKIGQGYREYPAVAVFAALKYHDLLGTKPKEPSQRADADNPFYVAIAILMGAGVDYDLIGNREHLATLAGSYGVSVRQIEEGIWKTLTLPWQSLLQMTSNLIQHSLNCAKETKDKTLFMSDAFLPFLTLTSRGYSVSEDVSSRFYSVFGALFSPQHLEALSQLTTAFQGYVQGGTLDVRYEIALNRLLRKDGFRLSLDKNHCVVYALTNYAIPIDTLGIGTVLMKKRIGVSLLGIDVGLATYSDSNVTITYDYIVDRTNDLRIVLSSDSLPSSFKPEANGLWRSMGIALTADRANLTYRALMRRQFSGLSTAEIATRIIRDVTVHELKHKHDEILHADQNWISMDFEVAAHLSEIVLGGIPIYGLFNLINRMQRFYLSVDDPYVKARLRPLIVKGWTTAAALEKGTKDESAVVAEARILYSQYTTLRGKKLPGLAEFERAISPRLASIPVFAGL